MRVTEYFSPGLDPMSSIVWPARRSMSGHETATLTPWVRTADSARMLTEASGGCVVEFTDARRERLRTRTARHVPTPRDAVPPNPSNTLRIYSRRYAETYSKTFNFE